jgi:cyanophycin synthetase
VQTTAIVFLRGGNVIDNGAGAVIDLVAIDPAMRLDAGRLAAWLTCLPTTLRLGLADLEGPQAVVVPRLLLALTEHARLEAAPARVLAQAADAMRIWLPVDDRAAAEAAVALVAHVVESVRLGRLPDATTARLWATLRSTFWNQTHAHLARAAREVGVPVQRIDVCGVQLLQLGHGCRLRRFRETLTDQTPVFAQGALNKEALPLMLEHSGCPLPAQWAVASLDEALVAAERIGWPVVLKPAQGGKGHGVWVGLADRAALARAWAANVPNQPPAHGGPLRQIVQQTLSGHDHRLLVVEGRLFAAARRMPAEVTSDGCRSLREQIAAINADPDRGVGYERLLNRVPIDERLEQLLVDQGFALDAVPPAGVRVHLSRAANLSQGGTAIDCTAAVHPDTRLLAEDVARLLRADVVGLDFISHDIRTSWRDGGTWLLEANLSPGLRPHLAADRRSDLCQRIVRRWMGDDAHGRIPIALVTGSVGKTTTTRMLAHVLRATGRRVGLTGSMGAELDGQTLVAGDLAGGRPALQMLQDSRVEALVAEIARGGILKSGLGIERADVAGILNVLDNHVGTDGIGSREQLASIKRIVASVADRLLALNADDPLVLAMGAGRDPGSIALVGRGPGSAIWQAHRDAGHVAATYETAADGLITLQHRGQVILSLALREIPASDDGSIAMIAPAAAFTAALAHGLGIGPAEIRAGLRGFGREVGHRRGRFETLFKEPWRVVLCWADGPQAMATLADYAHATVASGPSGRRLLLCSAPDNRPDEFLRAVGRATWGFDLVICASWDTRRGRSPHEVPALLAEGVRSLGPGGPTAVVAGVESEAVQALAGQIRPGDFCVVATFASDMMRERLLATLR